MADDVDLLDHLVPRLIQQSQLLATSLGEHIVFAGRALRRLLPAVGQQTCVLLSCKDGVECTLNNNHLCLLEFGNDLGCV